MSSVDPALIEDYRHIFNDIARTHLVPDIFPDRAAFLFILESPHIQELKFGAPVAGSSGLSMTKRLFRQTLDLPLGILAKQELETTSPDEEIQKVALMNVCQIPLQASAYANSWVVEKYHEELPRLEEIRVANQKTTFRDQHVAAIQWVLANSLRKKLLKKTATPLYVVPCGRFAQKFFRLANVTSPHWQWLEGIPHPSYNNWHKPEYKNSVDRLVEIFQSYRLL